MPASIRQWALRELTRAAGNVDWSGAHIYEVVKQYEDVHPEISTPLYQIMELLKACQESIIKVRSLI